MSQQQDVAIVTGAGRGIGRAAATTLAAEEIVAAAERQLGGSCGILVNAAGTTGPVSEVAKLDVDEWQ
jgi:NAD(P)-dependent dehydrogenase (short-subunit alcohol dehydrogenase family)